MRERDLVCAIIQVGIGCFLQCWGILLGELYVDIVPTLLYILGLHLTAFSVFWVIE